MDNIHIESGLLAAALNVLLPEIFTLELSKASVEEIITRLDQVGTAEALHLAGELAFSLKGETDGTNSDQNNWFSDAAGGRGDPGDRG